MTVREATGAERGRVHELLQAYFDEHWQRPFPPGPARVPELDGRVVLVAAASRRNGIGRELVRSFAAAADAAGARHVTLDVDTSNDVARAVWQRLGFAEYARRLATPLPALVERLEPPA